MKDKIKRFFGNMFSKAGRAIYINVLKHDKQLRILQILSPNRLKKKMYVWLCHTEHKLAAICINQSQKLGG